MDQIEQLEKMFGISSTSDEEQKIYAEAIKSINELEEIKKFFDSQAGQLFLSWFDEAKQFYYEKLEDCDQTEVLKIQSNLKAIKTLKTILEDKFEDLNIFKTNLYNM